jgi:predicted nucleotidyltransferase
VGTTPHSIKTDRSIADIPFERILSLQGYPDGSDTTVYVSGSVVTPFANPWSDIDIYAISDRGPTGELVVDEATNLVTQHFVGDQRVDYEFWRPVDIERLAERLDGMTLGVARFPPHGLFTYNEECLIHRLRVGVPMLNEERFERFRRLFDFEKLGKYQAQEAIRETDGFYEDVCGMLEAGDLDSAVLNARRLVELGADAYLHSTGTTDPNVKWRARHLQELDDGSAFHDEVRRTYWDLEFPVDVAPDADPEARHRYVERCIAFSRRVTSWIQS